MRARGRLSRFILTRRGGRSVGLVAALLLAVTLAACATIDPLSRDTCIAVVPALEPADARIVITALGEQPERPGNIRVGYTSISLKGTRLRSIVCAFGADAAISDRRSLIGVRTDRGELPSTRFYFLRRFWLGDPAAVAEGLAHVEIAEEALPRGLLRLPAGSAQMVQNGIDALAPSGLYALLALACSLVYGLLGRINFAFGEIAMLGAFATLLGALMVETVGISATGPLVAVGLVTAVVVAGAWGAALGRFVFRPLAFRAAQPMLVATVGLSMALSEFVARSQGVRERYLPPLWNRPLLVADGPFTVMVTPMRLFVAGLAIGVVAMVVVVWPRTRWGRQWRAVADDAVMAALLGIDPARVLVVTFTLASALAAIAGAILTLAYGGTSFHMGTMLGLKAVVAAVVGGMGSLLGAVLGGLLVGLMETVWSAAFGIEWRDVAVLSLLVVFLLFRPSGLLGTARSLEEDRS